MTKHKKVQLYGAGGHSKVVIELLQQNGVEVVSVLDDDTRKVTAQTVGVRRRNSTPTLAYPFIITIGDNALREEIVELLDVEYSRCVASSAIISPMSFIGEGTIVMNGAIVQANTRIGKHVLINTAANIDHDNVLEDFVHISPNAALCGHVQIGKGTHIGAGATVIPNVKIGKWCKIGAGAIVVNDIPDYSTVVGNPGRVIKQAHPLRDYQEEPQKEFDLVLVGSGLASTMTLIHLIENLKRQPVQHPPKVLLLEKFKDCFGGVAFGKRAGHKSLIITSLEDFLPPPERAQFVSWLNKNKHWVFDRFRANAGRPSSDWFQQNAKAIANNQWDQLFLPRYLFGEFLSHCCQQLLEEANQDQLIQFDQICANVTGIEKYGELFHLNLTDSIGRKSNLIANRIVLAIGSPPFNRLFNKKAYSPRLAGLLIDDPYQNGMSRVVENICSHVQSRAFDNVNVLLVGSNATAIEVIFNICENADLMSRLGKILVVSPSSEFPARFEQSDPTRQVNYEPQNLQKLIESGDFTAKEIYLAAKSDIFESRDQKIPFRTSFTCISRQMVEAVRTLSQAEQQIFVDVYGVEIGRYQRRAGCEYLNVVDELKASGKLQFITGRFDQIVVQSDAGLTFDYEDVDGITVRFDDWIQVAVNCTGFENVSPNSSSELIRNLLRNELCVANSSQMGFKVDENLAASPNFFVIGPMLGGNIIGTDLVWHAEHCGRIIKFAKQLAKHLSTDLFRGDAMPSIAGMRNEKSTEQ